MPRLGVIEINQLPVMQVLENISSDSIISQRMSQLVAFWSANDPPNAAQYDVGTTEFDPLRINQENGAYFEVMLRDRVNQAAKAVTLAFATGSDLDAIGSRYPSGMPRLTNESDDAYRTRIWLSSNTFTQNGVYENYIFFALTAAATAGTPLRDAQATATPGSPNVTVVIMADGDDIVSNGDGTFTNAPTATPTDAQISTVYSYIVAPGMARKGLTDIVNVRAPKIVEVDYRIRVQLLPGWDKESTMVQLWKAFADLMASQRWLGYSHTLAAVDAALKRSGVFNVLIDSPEKDVLIPTDAVVVPRSILIEYAGRAGVGPLPPNT